MDDRSRLEPEEEQLRQWFHQFGPPEREPEFILDRQDLSQRLQPLQRHRRRTAVRRTATWWAAVASLLLVLGLGLFHYTAGPIVPSSPHTHRPQFVSLPKTFTYIPYRNMHSAWPFSILVPTFLKKGATPTDRAGQRWTFGRASVTAYGEGIPITQPWRRSLVDLAVGRKGRAQHVQQGSNWETVTGTRTVSGQVLLVFEKGVIVGSNLYVLRLVYPETPAQEWRPVVQKVVNSFRPGSLKP